MDEEDKIYHQVGQFFVHFPSDLTNIIDLLNENGYGVCETLNGDMIIMKSGEYDDDEIAREMGCEDDDDGFDDDDYGDMTSGLY